MTKENKLITVTKCLAYLSLIAIIFAHLALTDISRNNEPDLTSEWMIVRVAFIIIIAFIASTLMTLKKTKHSTKSCR